MSDVFLPLARSSMLSQFPNLICGMSTRQGGERDSLFGFNLGLGIGDDDTRVRHNRMRFFSQLGLRNGAVAFQDQVHETNISIVHDGGIYERTDALASRNAMLGLTVSAADCAPLLMYAPGENTIAAIHAGWRGTMQRIAAKSLLRLQEEFRIDIRNIYVWIAPSAGPCCYEVGEDVGKHFSDECITRATDGTIHLDLKAANRLQLIDAGIPTENIETSGHCTICRPSVFHSYRRDGEYAGRMLAVIAMREEI